MGTSEAASPQRPSKDSRRPSRRLDYRDESPVAGRIRDSSSCIIHRRTGLAQLGVDLIDFPFSVLKAA
jgi:hypothetical protein